MRIHVVSDVHGSTTALRAAGVGADALVCLGDLLLYLDYTDPSQGIFAELFGAVATARYIGLRTEQRFDEARELTADLWAEHGEDRSAALGAHADKQYAELFAALPTPAYLTYGNVDLPALWAEHLRPGQHVLDGQTVELDGLVFGFVGGGLRTRYRTPFEVSDEEYAAKVEALGQVDVLCAHIPPALPEITYDVVARRFERGSEATLEAIRRTQPRMMLHGHVHQPLVARTRIGRTEVVNVGHFRGRGEPYVMQW